MKAKPNITELLAKAQKPSEDSLRLHPVYRGKLEVTPKCRIKDSSDFAIWYTPGVAAPCRDIAAHPEQVFVHTNKANFIAIVSDGTRVLGLGDIGPHAALPVMEGKAILFKYLGEWMLSYLSGDQRSRRADSSVQMARTYLRRHQSGRYREAEVFYILDRLRKEMTIPVWHDDQQGTAAVTLAGLINALKIVGKNKQGVRIALIGPEPQISRL
jgi:malate dehydrogenase (oxaloacetate-decarboxylating)